MSGIAGLLQLDGAPALREELTEMLGAMAHRGPDGARATVTGPLGLGHLLLRTTAADAALPLANRRGDLLLTADVRLDNRAELIKLLGLRDQPAREIGNGALLLAAYERWGENCPQHLLGDFAFAIWDAPRQRLFCARDHFGVRPFYYYHGQGRFAFASEIKALLALHDVSSAVNDERVAEFLFLFESAGKDETFYRAVKRLPPGYTLVVAEQQLRLRRYWALDPTQEIRLGSNKAYAEHFAALFKTAVETRLESDYPVGVVFSGGLDSAAVTCVAAEKWQGPQPLHTFSAYFTGVGDTDERRYIDAVLRNNDLIAHKIDGNDLALTPAEVDRIVGQVEEPFWYAFQLVLWRLYGIARASGVRVLLDGMDGDSTVADSRSAYMAALLRRGRLAQFALELDGMARRPPPKPGRYSWRVLRNGWAYGVEPLLLAPLRRIWRRGHNVPEQADRDLLNPQLPLPADLPQRRKHFARSFNDPNITERQAHYIRLVESAFPFHLEMLNRAAALFSIEYRHPFFDKRLVEFCLALPPGQLIQRGENRSIMRRALADVLPPEILARPGKGVVMHHYQRVALTTGDPSLAATIMDAVPELSAYLDRERMLATFERYLGSAQAPPQAVWYAASLALWLRHNIKSSTRLHNML